MSMVTIPAGDADDAADSCPLADEMHLLVEFAVHDDRAGVRRVANGFALSMVGCLCGPHFDGAYFTVTDSHGVELADQDLDHSPLHVGVRSVGVDDPDGALLEKVARILRNNLVTAADRAGVSAAVTVSVLPG